MSLNSASKQDLIAAVAQILPLEDGALIWFGNRDGQDVDLLAVGTKVTEQGWCHGAIDLLVLDREACSRLVTLSDPVVTEPLRTGEVVAGQERVWSTLRDLFLTTKTPHPDAPPHLLRRALTEYRSALLWIDRYFSSSDPGHAAYGLLNLSFYCTYLLSARSARAGVLPASLDSMLAECALLGACRRASSAIKRGARIQSPERLRAFVAAAEDLLLCGSNTNPEALGDPTE